jgi:ribosomal-protein-alanine N-acetyltransferase
MRTACLKTPRLTLRPWRDSDLADYTAMNADPRVMEYYVKTWTAEESAASGARLSKHFTSDPVGKWIVETNADHHFVGLVGLARVDFEAPFSPCVEIGWRLAHEHWGRAYATEAARAALRYAFEDLKLGEIVAFTAPTNLRSRRLMDRLGMIHSPAEDFDHPRVPEGHPVRRHVLYRLSKVQWEKTR